MKAITVRQPYAWAIARGHKPIENRTWTTPYRGPLAIHAAMRWDDDGGGALLFCRDHIRAQGGTYPRNLASDAPYSDRGCVVAVVDLVGICSRSMDGEPCDCGPWAMVGQAHWHLRNPQLHHVPSVRGRLGLWEWDETGSGS